MNSKLLLVGALCALVLVSTVTAAHAQSTQSTTPQAMPPMPKPGPEHAIFKEDAGTWDAVVEMFMEPGAAPMTSKGVETNVIGCGGLCVVTEFKGEMPGAAFEGHGLATYDVSKKKYVGSWTDSMSLGLAVSEGTWDPANRTFTGWMEGPDLTGKTVRTKTVGEYKTDGRRIFTAYSTGADGKESVQMRITYTRRK